MLVLASGAPLVIASFGFTSNLLLSYRFEVYSLAKLRLCCNGYCCIWLLSIMLIMMMMLINWLMIMCILVDVLMMKFIIISNSIIILVYLSVKIIVASQLDKSSCSIKIVLML